MSKPAKRCAACGASYRTGSGALAYVGDGSGELRRARVCGKCAKAAVRVLVAPTSHDPRACLECKKAPAALCEACVMAARKAAVRSALQATKAEPSKFHPLTRERRT